MYSDVFMHIFQQPCCEKSCLWTSIKQTVQLQNLLMDLKFGIDYDYNN